MAYAVEPTTQASQTSHSYSPCLLPEHRPERAVVFGRSSGFVSEDEPVTEPSRQRNKKRAVSCDRKRSLESTFGYIEEPCQESAASFEHERSTKLPANLEYDQRAESALASGNMADTRTGQTLPVESLLASGYGTECEIPSSSERKHCKSFATETDDSPAPCTIEDHAVVFSHRTALQIASAIALGQCRRIRTPVELANVAPERKGVERAVEELRDATPNLFITRPAHYLVGSRAFKHRTERHAPHHVAVTMPSSSILRLSGGSYCCSPALAFVQSVASMGDAGCIESKIAMLELGWELCGTYRTKKTARQTVYDAPQLTTVRTIKDFVRKNGGMHGINKVRRLLPYLVDNSASPRETKLALLLMLPCRFGGYGFGMPVLNREISATQGARALARKGSFRGDIVWPRAKLDVEYQSREQHSGEQSRIEDSRRTNALTLMGWNVVEITNAELDDLAAMDQIARTIRSALKAHTGNNINDYARRKAELRQALGLPT